MPDVIEINNKNYTLGFGNKGCEIIECVEAHMGHEFAMYVNEYIDELIVKSDKAYWDSHSDEQAYEEELNEKCSLLDELWDYFAEIKEIAISKYKNMPEWGYIAEEGMDLINKNT